MKALTYIEHGKFALLEKPKPIILDPRDSVVRVTANVEAFCGELNPVTRKPENSKAYNRKKSQNWKRELPLTCLRLSS